MNETNQLSFDSPGAVHVWRAELHLDGAAYARCEALLAPAERARAARFHFERDRRHFTSARGTLRQLLGRYLGVAGADLQFAAGPHGKPALLEPAAGLRFNLSHSGGRALFAFALEREVGIDLEAGLRLGDDWPGLVRRIFSPREQAELAGLPPARQRDAFLNGWTRKEAYLKATGNGLVNGLHQIEVTLDPAGPAAFQSEDLAREWTLQDLRHVAEVAAALVVQGTPVDVAVRLVE